MRNLLFDLPEEIMVKVMQMNPRPFHSELVYCSYVGLNPNDRDYDMWWLYQKNCRLARAAAWAREKEEERERERLKRFLSFEETSDEEDEDWWRGRRYRMERDRSHSV